MTDADQKQVEIRSDTGRFFLPPLKVHLLFWPVASAVTALDLWTKSRIFDWLTKRPEPVLEIIDGFLRFVVRENPGAAFGIAAGQRTILTAVSVIAIIVILVIFCFGKIQQKLMAVALGLFTGGILGNLYDRIFNDGLVRDFIDVYYRDWHWPAFNVADSALCIAVGLIIISSFLGVPTDKPVQKRAQQHK